MKAISLWEPWASLIAFNAKQFETRSWGTNYRGELLICAAQGGLTKENLRNFMQQPMFKKYIRMHELNFGKAVAVVNLIDCIRITVRDYSRFDYREISFGNFRPGRYAWKLQLIERIEKPFEVKGHQGFFNVNYERGK